MTCSLEHSRHTTLNASACRAREHSHALPYMQVICGPPKSEDRNRDLITHSSLALAGSGTFLIRVVCILKRYFFILTALMSAVFLSSRVMLAVALDEASRSGLRFSSSSSLPGGKGFA